MSKEVRALIFQMVAENPTWGAPRIHGELLMLGFDVSEPTVSRWVRRAPRPPDPAKRWLTFLRNHREAIAAMDFFTVPTLTFGILYCFFVIGHDRRRILHFNVTRNPHALWVTLQLHDRAERALETRLAENGHPLVPFGVDAGHYDIPLLLSQRLERNSSVFSVTGLSHGGGKESANAYRALNIRREYFVDYAIRLVIWLNRDEAKALSRHAPDFWAFRHRVVEFNDPVYLEPPELPASEWTGAAQGFAGRAVQLGDQIRLNEEKLANLPEQAGTRTQRLELLIRLAGLYQAKKAYDRSIQCLQQGKQIARQLNDTAWLAAFWSKLGLVYLDLEQPLRAVRACRKAVRLNPRDASFWSTLGHLYHVEERFSDAIIAYKHAIQLDPQSTPAKSGLAACYRRMKKNALAEKGEAPG